MTAPVVSVVIPTYNHGRFLRAALTSVCAQTLVDWEAVVVNNFSQDDTVEIVNSFSDERISRVDFANHGVIAASRNHGVRHTCAPYIAFLDSDDAWSPSKLAACVAYLERGYDLVCHAETWVGPGDRRRTVTYGPEARASYDKLLFEGNCISTSAVVVRRELFERVGGFSELTEFVTAEDYELWLRLAGQGAKIGFLDEVLGVYLIHEGNQSRLALRNMEAVLAVVDHHLASAGGGSAKARRRKALVYYGGARGLQDNSDYGQAWSYFWKAVRIYPWVPKFYAAMALNLLRRKP